MNKRIESELGEAVDMVRDTIERAYDAGLKDGKLVGSESARKRIVAMLREEAAVARRNWEESDDPLRKQFVLGEEMALRSIAHRIERGET